MLKAKLKEASILKKVVDAIKDLVNDANFICTDEGIQLQAMDASHVALITLTLLGEGFTSYECDDVLSLGIKIPVLAKVLKCAENTDSIELTASSKSDNLGITITSPNGLRDCTFELPLMDIDAETMDLPDIEYSASAKIPYSNLKKVISDLSGLGDTCRVSIEKKKITFGVTGDIGKASFTLHEDLTPKLEENQTQIDNELEKDISLTYAIKYLNAFVKTSGLSERVGIYMSQEVPLFVTYDLGEIGSVNYYLAPKITDD